MVATGRAFATIPPEAAAVLRPVLPGLADEAIAAIAVEVPGYARAMEGEFGRAVRRGVVVAFNRFVDLVLGEGTDSDSARATYVDLGRGEFHAGRSLDALLAAYRVGARLAWRRFVEAGKEGGLPPEVLYDLGEAIFAYIDELSAESAEGYAEEQSAAAGESQRRRRRLVRLLAQDPPASEESIRSAASAAAWVLPRALAAVVAGAGEPAPAAPPAVPAADPAEPGAAAAPGSDGAVRGVAIPGEEVADALAARLARRVGGGAVGAAAAGLACVFVPDPDAPGRRRQLEAALAGERAAIGPTVPWARSGTSAARAAAAFRLAAAGRVEGDLVAAEDHLAAMLLAADPALAAEFADKRLAPLAELADGARERLTATLRAWLDQPGRVQAVAAVLGVHPQTVRYRLARLRELFGDALEDPEARFELALALRASSPLRPS
jgi:PucR C-terminal helix-turn-helix domain